MQPPTSSTWVTQIAFDWNLKKRERHLVSTYSVLAIHQQIIEWAQWLTSPPWLKKHRKGSTPYRYLWRLNCVTTDQLLQRTNRNVVNWHGSCIAKDRKALQWVIKTVQNMIGTHLQGITDIGDVRCMHRAQSILKDNTHPVTVCSPCSCLSVHCRAARMWNCRTHPQQVL